ncbi:MAG: hypothetical protein JWO19_4812 [Bryobacterales bacterium]|nr:hypothetical protein [Bryobacterales bacterium]
MMRVLARIPLIAILSGAAFGQSTEAPPAFELADVHVSPHATNLNMSGGVLRAGRYDLRKATMVDMIRIAYGVDADKVLGGPSWLETDRFDVIAKAPPSTSPETLRLMLQALLADRFKLVVHNETKPLPAFALTVGKGKPKLKEAEGSGGPGCQGQPQPAPPAQVMYVVVTCRNMTMEVFVRNLRGFGGPYFSVPVVDMTGLKGSWDVDLKFTPRALIAITGADAITIFDAVDKQLGLKLDQQTIPAAVIVVDSVNQKPTANPPGVTTSLPPRPPAEFEVADIKPSMPGATNQMARIQNGRVDVQNFPLKTLITLAWDINSDEMLAGAPKFLDSARFDIIAKVSTSGPANAPQVDFDDLRLMLRALLVDRFKIVTHTEDRPVTAYTLLAAKPKLKKADPSNRTAWKEGPAPASKDPRDTNPILARLVTCTNMTMAQFADLLPNIAPGYIRTPVLDSTGIEGAWDFTFNFTPAGLGQGGGGGGRGGDAPQPAASGAPGASDPNGALTLFDALNKQLGLKLEMQKRPMPVLVIDHVEEKPTEN